VTPASGREQLHDHGGGFGSGGTKHPVSALVWLAARAAALTLLAGMGLTWADANTGNTLVQNTLDAGRWLATPFADVFTNSDPEKQLYANWGLTAASTTSSADFSPGSSAGSPTRADRNGRFRCR
jgi:Ca2+-binding RTX toxin-like protein